MSFWDSLKSTMQRADAAAAAGDLDAGRLQEAAQRSPVEQRLLERLRGTDGTLNVGAAQVRLHLRFSGEVQGVGFRWTNQGLARDRGLTGWVRNEPDGTVQMELQGQPQAIAAHLDAVHEYYRRFGNRIWLDEEREEPLAPGERKLEVRY